MNKRKIHPLIPVLIRVIVNPVGKQVDGRKFKRAKFYGIELLFCGKGKPMAIPALNLCGISSACVTCACELDFRKEKMLNTTL